ncbi:hypothetical protein LP420_10280 [Massilia sp. B-10]|nr:hypothetical protein LP420_10280 [Massilia sp. B-10]
MLIEAAARQWNVPLNACRTERGVVIRSDGARLRYAELAAAAATLAVPDEPLLKDPSQFTLIGKALMGVDTPAIVRGEARYGIDARTPACWWPSSRCPLFGGALKSVDDTAARKVPGVLDVVRMDAAAKPTQMRAWRCRGRHQHLGRDAGPQGAAARMARARRRTRERRTAARRLYRGHPCRLAPCCAATATWAPPWRPARPCTKPCSKRPSWPTPRWNR